MRKVDILRKRLPFISFYSDYDGFVYKGVENEKAKNEIINRVCKRLTKNQIRRVVEINRSYLTECEYILYVTIEENIKNKRIYGAIVEV